MLEGEIDITTVDLLAEWLAAAAALERPIVIDLAGVTFLGSTGVQALLRARGLGPVQVRSARGVVARCLELTGLERLLEEPPPAPPGERWQPVPRC
jgi:anti-anti-sigma factor